MSSIFGWSYPPGCSGPPHDDEDPCEICGEIPDNCICPECSVCGEQGDPICYDEHHMVRTPEQIANRARREAELEANNRAQYEEAELKWSEDHMLDSELWSL